jgi:hypothetical protein
MRIVVSLLAALLLLPLADPARGAERIVAIGDIHGSYDGLTSILEAAGLVDEELNWSGGSTVLVQTGDYLDRGVELQAVVTLLRRLQEQAPAAGGRVEIVLGNHEALNLLGVMRDVAPEAFTRFIDDGSEERRQEAYRRWLEWARQTAKRRGGKTPDDSAAERGAWMQRVPLGLLEYLDWIAPGGELGRYLRRLPTVTTIDGLTFVHGGLPPALADLSDAEINERVWSEIRDLDECRSLLLQEKVIHETADPNETITHGMQELARLREQIDRTAPPMRRLLVERAQTLQDCVSYQDWWLVTDEGPLWFRGFAHWTESDGTPLIDELCATRGVRGFVVGHTTQRGRIGTRFGGRVFLIDTGMLSSHYQGGRPAALEIVGDRFNAIYEDRRELLFGDPSVESTAAAGQGPSGDGAASAGVAVAAGGYGNGQGESWGRAAQRIYLGADAEPLPFQDADSIVRFLATAEIVGAKRIDQGINQPFKLTLERDGVRAHAVFRTVDVKKERYRAPDGQFFPVFRDSYVHEVAAFELARLLGIDAIPPVSERTYLGKRGSIQLWIENVIDDKTRIERGFEPPGLWWVQQKILRKLFDALISNIDRNAGNVLVEPDSWTIWLIDHTRSFFEQTDLVDRSVLGQCERNVFERMKELDRQEVGDRLDPYLSTGQLHYLFERWDLLVEHFEALVAERGADVVLFDIEPASR